MRNAAAGRDKRGRRPERVVAAAEVTLWVTLAGALLWVTPVAVGSGKARLAADVLLAGVGLVVSVGLNVYHGERARDLGFRMDNLGAAMRELAVFTIGSVLLLLALAALLDSFGPGRRFFRQLRVMSPWVLAQQYLVQAIVNRRLQVIFGEGWLSAGLTAAIFAAAHLPNPVLTAVTLVSGWRWALAYEKHPNLLANALSQLLLSAVLVTTMPKQLLPTLRVGWAYLSAP